MEFFIWFWDLLFVLRDALGDETLGIIAVIMILVVIFSGQLFNIPGFDDSQPSHDLMLHPGNRATETGQRVQDDYIDATLNRAEQRGRRAGRIFVVVTILIPVICLFLVGILGIAFGL